MLVFGNVKDHLIFFGLEKFAVGEDWRHGFSVYCLLKHHLITSQIFVFGDFGSGGPVFNFCYTWSTFSSVIELSALFAIIPLLYSEFVLLLQMQILLLFGLDSRETKREKKIKSH